MLKSTLIIFQLTFWSILFAQVDSTLITNIKSTTTKVEKSFSPEPNELGEIFKPKISIGIGRLSFHGDLYDKHFQAPSTSRIGYDLNISQRLSKSLQLNFNVLFGKLGANEWTGNRQENFQAEIRSGGLNVMYDFANFISENHKIRPWISIGVNSLEFLSKTDLYDKGGNKYFYWSDGSIKNMDQASPSASLAVNLNRDYSYETDIREANKDGFGKYQERSLSFPIGFGALMKVTGRIDVKMGVQYYFTTTDYIDGITNKSIGARAGTKFKDKFVYSSFSIQYDLIITKRKKQDTLPRDYYDKVDVLALLNEDYDQDGVMDIKDNCHGTPLNVKIDVNGCPLDDDIDGVPNHIDTELATLAGSEVNKDGVALNDAFWQDWYDQYNDTGKISKSELVQNFYTKKIFSASTKTDNLDEKAYAVELGRYTGTVPDEDMSYLLSVGDVKSTTLPDNTTTVYSAGSYEDINKAVKRLDKFKAEGNKKASIGVLKNGNLTKLSDEAIVSLIKSKTEKNNKNESSEEEFVAGGIVYRVQLGVYKNKISKNIFQSVNNILEVKTDNNFYRYTTKGFNTIEEAANAKADLVIDGYGDAFITAYKDGKRIPMSQTKATMETDEIEDITKIEAFSSADKSLVSFQIQLGALYKTKSEILEDRTKDLKGVEKQTTETGLIRYTVGQFNDYSKANEFREELKNRGLNEAFIIATFKGEIISIQEALELLK